MHPLDGITILDLTRLLPGAFATLLLADMGATVIKIEDPRGGDPMRQMPPVADGSGVYHHVLNRGKQSVTLDLRSPDAYALLNMLVAHADVLVESFRPQTARRLRVSAELRTAHPRLIHCSITGFGQTGPYAERAGHDINYVALAGLLAVDGHRAGEAPRMPRMFIADIGGGALSAVAGILAALLARERKGTGSAVDVSMHEGALSWLAVPAASALVDGREPGRETPITGGEACYNVYRTSDDRFVALGALEPKFWARFCTEIDRPDWVPLQYAAPDVQARLIDELATIFRARPRDEWVRRFEPADVCLTAVNSVSEALADPHALARGAVVRDGARRIIRAPFRFSMHRGKESSPVSTDEASLAPAPPLGSHTDEVLGRVGVGPERLRDLRDRGVI